MKRPTITTGMHAKISFSIVILDLFLDSLRPKPRCVTVTTITIEAYYEGVHDCRRIAP